MPTKETREQKKARWEAAMSAIEFPAEFQQIIKNAFEDYAGDITVFESAVGTLFLGFMVGWRPLLIIHNTATVKRYERLLGVNFRELMPETTPISDRSRGFAFAQQVGNYWDAVRGTLRVDGRQEAVDVDELPGPV